MKANQIYRGTIVPHTCYYVFTAIVLFTLIFSPGPSVTAGQGLNLLGIGTLIVLFGMCWHYFISLPYASPSREVFVRISFGIRSEYPEW